MGFISWHYSTGLDYYLSRWQYGIDWVVHYFSLKMLLGSLFAPWKRMIVDDKTQGYSGAANYFQRVTFNMVSRVVGAMFRLIIFLTGTLILILIFPIGGFGLWLWLIFPPIGLTVYSRYRQRVESVVGGIVAGIKHDPGRAIELLLDNPAGKFMLEKLGVGRDELVGGAEKVEVGGLLEMKDYRSLVAWFIGRDVWREEFFRKRGLVSADMEMAAYWWDRDRRAEMHFDGEDIDAFATPGLALELLYGYTPTLDQHGVDLSAPQSFSHRLIGRQKIVMRMERALTGGMSVIITGEPGVGKKTVILEFARRARLGQFGSSMSYRKVVELDYNMFLSEAKDLNLKKSKFASALREAAGAGNIILVLRDIHRLTNAEVEGYDFTDIFEEYLEKRDLKVIAISARVDYERFIAPNMRLRKFFETVEVTQPTAEEALRILIGAADRWEKGSGVSLTVPAIRRIIDGSERYITDVPFPEKALELLDSVVMFKKQQGQKQIEAKDIDYVLAEKTGITITRLTDSDKKRLGNLEEIIHERLVNQELAVNYIARTLRARAVGATSEKRPIGSFLFLGPTGVGKTETAKVLARVYYGSEGRILRFDMSEYAGSEGLERLIGSQSRNRPGTLTTAIKNQPASLLLLDEFEKATSEIMNLFLALLDEGMITDAFGRKVNCRHLFVIGTSNAAAEFIRKKVNAAVAGEELQRTVVEHVLEERVFSPELLNRFDGVVVYEPLSKEHLVKIARLLLMELTDTMKKKNIELEATSEACEKLAEEGYDPAFGARPMRRIIDIVLGDVIGKAILSGEIKEGDRAKIMAGQGERNYFLEKIVVS